MDTLCVLKKKQAKAGVRREYQCYSKVVIMCSELLQAFFKERNFCYADRLIKIHLKCILYWIATVNNILKMYLGGRTGGQCIWPRRKRIVCPGLPGNSLQLRGLPLFTSG